VWIYLLQRVQYGGFKQLKRAQARISIPEIMEACSWYSGYRKEMPTKDQIYQILQWLRKPLGVAYGKTAGATQGMLINIDNSSFYRNPKNYGSNSEGSYENEVAATREQRQPDNINKNEKNEKKKEKKKTRASHN
jgi:hypothetical protein